jgi:hypothetical protein
MNESFSLVVPLFVPTLFAFAGCSSSATPVTPEPTIDAGEFIDSGSDPIKDSGTRADTGQARDSGPKDSGPSVKRVFTLVTAAKITGDIKTAGGKADALASADALCTNAAATAMLGSGPWKAWLSTTATSALSRISDVGPWYLVDGTTMAFANKAALSGPAKVDGEKWLNQDGKPNGLFSLRIWTGTTTSGSSATENCMDWTSALATKKGSCGTTLGVGAKQPVLESRPRRSASVLLV